MKITFKKDLTTGKEVKTSEILDAILKSRGIKNFNEFIKPPFPFDYSLKDFGFKKKEIDKVMKLLQKIREKDQSIVVYTDYDADGITGGAILWETLHFLGFKAMPYVPHRRKEGYGFSNIGIDNVKKLYDPALIISVDHGITAVKQIAYAKKLGIPVIITDHHQKLEKIPKDAEAIFHIPVLSGSGTAYFFAKEVFEHFRHSELDSESKTGSRNKFGMTDEISRLSINFETDYLALASIGTVADLVPLVDFSRSIVAHGLAAFPKVKRYGIRHIMKEAGIAGRPISPYEIGFIIAPRINAVGRLEHAIDALRLLCTTDEKRAYALASKVGQKNVERQDLVKQSVEEALKELVKMEKKGLPKLIILHSKKWHEGIIGLIASRILETYYRPVIVMTEGDGQLKASARSIVSFHITKFFESMKDMFINYGGHAQAAGFTMERRKLDNFMKTAVKKADKLIKDSYLERVIEADLKIPLNVASIKLAKELYVLRPFGIGNPQPTFVSDASLAHAQLLGKNQNHLKITVKSDGMMFPVEMVAWGKADLFTSLSSGQKVQVVYSLDVNKWNGREKVQGKVIAFLQHI
ncbi:single-stranded-DNA-specific exonuclease RecJ [Candidatus Roizmanbacteria bacterium RIFCSPLOWO2_01_FULL_38_12]|uniref:Single-stranded-DNA-specific exonuclease RecJ n=1 Tax=Candidatus Roizmanbacteria bacterium RIFCSPLOWO2_01_FULL_38_12 TaxID=1802061 RepID=A0A1F7IXV5_9BACT|nr:MAG: single-stranded-DNA-specific exonuclease RecJ [Candidatus Roizmanbacteria bacterium RIFCSPHIGHO2_01_FULL_38_15]OGK35280.1 MAG: single-stranded-DNA-specific exonuclease RecJ [Candidatus Roizmanbacteria bacterium RIFCSPHIGHO2_12_FULL_38_13]OGK48206.1 MAG: single-stranded-DNA-specific exonuclease RecJ [Candidatus Roizmanbacteria bacterium RIFCSPLOWO2_01_FULL_38_12]